MFASICEFPGCFVALSFNFRAIEPSGCWMAERLNGQSADLPTCRPADLLTC
ncbi:MULTISPECIES: hypothetical protein [Burkholderia]|uniref:hypothetical protein n=1 Tax=Burkholderia TaxID=32008 RepID=UPI000AC34E4F|nr:MULTISPECIES: hypothetical protein [Burkholderia]